MWGCEVGHARSVTSIYASLDSLDLGDLAVAALAFGVLMAGASCYLAVTAAGRESTGRNWALIASGALCALAVGFAVVFWLLQARAR